jgi:putative membrane protein
MRSVTQILLATLLIAGLACKKSDETAVPPTAATPAPSPAPAPAPATLTDPQIAAIVLAANQVDIDAGTLAARKSSNDDVKKFADRMVTDHTGVNRAAAELAGRLGVTPEATDASRGLLSGGAEVRGRLEGLEGAGFDRAYVENEVAYHQAVLGILDEKLIPSARNAELKKMLVDVRPAFVSHLEHAKQIQSALAGGRADATHAGR